MCVFGDVGDVGGGMGQSRMGREGMGQSGVVGERHAVTKWKEKYVILY